VTKLTRTHTHAHTCTHTHTHAHIHAHTTYAPPAGPLFPNKGDQERFWRITKRFVDELGDAVLEGGCSKNVNAVRLLLVVNLRFKFRQAFFARPTPTCQRQNHVLTPFLTLLWLAGRLAVSEHTGNGWKRYTRSPRKLNGLYTYRL
jgi:hypothetical protein